MLALYSGCMPKSSSELSWTTTAKVTWFLWWRWSGLALLFTLMLVLVIEFFGLDPERGSLVAFGLGLTAHLLVFGPIAVRAHLKEDLRKLTESPGPRRNLEKPKGLLATAVILCTFSLAGVPTIEGVLQGRIVSLATVAAFTALWLLMIWFYWCGRNWARWVIMIGTLLSFGGFIYLPERLYDRVYLIAEALYGAFLLYWLNTRRVRNYFAGIEPVREDALQGSA